MAMRRDICSVTQCNAFQRIQYVLLLPIIGLYTVLFWFDEGRNNKLLVGPVLLLCLLSFFYSSRHIIKSNAKNLALWAAILFVGWMSLIDVTLGYSSAAIRGFLIAILLVTFFPKFLLTDKLWAFLSCIASVGLFGYLLYQGEILGLGRGSWHINAIPLSTLSASVLIVGCLLCSVSKDKWVRYCSVIAIAFSFATVMYAQTRGVWLALLCVGVSTLWCNRQWFTLSRLVGLLLLSLVVVGISSPFLFERFQQTLQEYTQIADKGNLNTSVGLRFQMWDAALQLVPKAGFFGLGDSHSQVLEQLFVDNKVDEGLISFNPTHYHNQYLTVWVKLGIIGLVLFAFFFFIPLLILRGHTSPYKKAIIALMVLYGIASLTDAPFLHASTIIIFIFTSQMLMHRHFELVQED